MFVNYIQSKHMRGFTLVEGLVLLAIFSLISLTFYSMYVVAINYIGESKTREQAVGLANEKMETLRNLPYDQVAVAGGIPAGSLQQNETATLNGRNFHVYIEVEYADDAFDGVAPTDADPNDYKKVKVYVKWGGETESEQVMLVSRFVPPGVENSIGGGILSINTIDSAGSPVEGVSLHIQNSSVSPAVNYSTTTGSDGNATLIGAQASNSYAITATKSGYETVTTLPPPPGTTYTPVDIHATVAAGVVNQKSIVINQLSGLHITTVDPFDAVISNVDIPLRGGRRLDTNASPPVYNFNQTETSDGGGEISLSDVSGGTYTINLFDTDGVFVGETGQYVVWKFLVGGGVQREDVEVPYGTTLDTKLVLFDTAVDSLVVYADTDSGSPIPGATIHVTDAAIGYDMTETADEYGSAYFPTESGQSLQVGETYTIEVSASGYQDGSNTVTLSAGLNEQVINLVAS